jgi:exodeoxyribonuclease VII small subunit
MPVSEKPAESGNESIGYEQARAELREIVRALEAGGQPLEQSLQLWQRGEELAGICREWLDGARATLEAAIAADTAPAAEND